MMSISSISTSPGAAARNSDSDWQYSEQIYARNPLQMSNHIINFDIHCTESIILTNCYVGAKHTDPEADEAVYSYRGLVVMNDCTIKGVVNAPSGHIKAKDCLIIGKVTGSIFPITLTTTEIRSRDYIKTEITPRSGFDAWIDSIKDSDDAIYQFNIADIDYYNSLMDPEDDKNVDSLTHFAILADDDDVECHDRCKIYGDIINNRYCIDDDGREIKVYKSLVAGSILNNGGNTLLEQSSAKAVYSQEGLTEINNSTVDFIYAKDSNTLIHNHSVIRQGAILGGRNNEILSSTLNGAVKLRGHTLIMKENTVVDEICLPPPGETKGDFIPCITLESGSVLKALETHGQPCCIRIGEGATFTLLINPEIIPGNVEIIYL
ncbi:MAG: hypothetical protein PW844_26095 [Pantoea sp.]|uniref:hypothetical protein n=1 Tax=Pantoea sp. TaxID=69393 RepID=UPI0023A66884|nr:hypothetical protein [Pantoea sp.]MDE1189892.1 hypothetical protein [Pantoea sp.]